MIYGKEKSRLPSKEKESVWQHGIVLSFDFVVESLKLYYSAKSPQGAYEVMKRYLLDHGFQHKKDTDYVHKRMDRVAAVGILVYFAEDNKWFPFCVRKLIISPNIMELDIAAEFQQLGDEEFKKAKEQEAEERKQRKGGSL